jgi:hypothetical protein
LGKISVFLGNFFPNFNLKKIFLTYAKEVSWEETQIHQNLSKKFKFIHFNDKLIQQVAKNIERF